MGKVYTKKEEDVFYIKEIVDDLAVIESSKSGRSGLYNLITNEIIGKIDYYFIETDPYHHRCIQLKDDGTFNYYDLRHKRFILYDFELVKEVDTNYSVCVVKSKKDNKTYLFDQELRYKLNIEVDDALKYKIHFEDYILLTFNGKKALYEKGRGLLTDFDFDDLEERRDITIFSNDNKKSFSYNKNLLSRSEEFLDIEVDENYEDIIYCYDGNYTNIFDLTNKNLILKTKEKAKAVSYYYSSNKYGEYLFIVKDGDKKKILSSLVKDGSEDINVKVLIDDCDDITFDYEQYKYFRRQIFRLSKNNHEGFFIGNRYHNKIIEPVYDEARYLFDDLYCLTYKGVSNIVRCFYNKENEENIIHGCSSIEKVGKIVIYGKKRFLQKEKFGLMHSIKDLEPIIVPANNDSIKHVGGDYFEVEKNSKKGLYYLDKLIIPKEYNNIKISYPSRYCDSDEAKYIHFSLEKEKSYLLAKRKDNLDEKSECIDKLGEFSKIEFLDDLIICKTDKETFIYDYYDDLLGVFPLDISIEKADIDRVYIINGEYYSYVGDKLIKLYQDNIEIHTAVYDDEKYDLKVSSSDKETFDKFVNVASFSTVDKLIEEGMTYRTACENSILEKKYPSLVFKREFKKTSK